MSIKIKKYPKEQDVQFQIKGNKLFGDDLILILTNISDIRNTTFLQKEVFLLWKEYLYEQSADLSYFPYHFGPYSYVIQRFSEYLEKLGMIKIKKMSKTVHRYIITKKGRDYIQQRMKNFKIDMDSIKAAKDSWDEHGNTGMLRQVYKDYPQYTSLTKRPSLKWY